MRRFGSPSRDRPGHAAGRLDLLDVGERAGGEIVGEALDEERAAPGIDDPRRSSLGLQQELGVAGDAGGEVGRQRQGLVERIGVQALGSAGDRRHRLDGGARDIVEDVARAARLQPLVWVWARRASERGSLAPNCLAHQLGPQQAAGALLGHLHEVVHAGVPEERQARGEGVDRHAGGDPGADIVDAVGEGVGELEIERGPGLLHVVAADRDAVELRHLRAPYRRRCPR